MIGSLADAELVCIVRPGRGRGGGLEAARSYETQAAGADVKHCGLPAAYVVRDLAGKEWNVCEFHGDPASAGATWIVRTAIADWFRARAMPPPTPPPTCFEARGSEYSGPKTLS